VDTPSDVTRLNETDADRSALLSELPSDDELCALALAADPSAPLSDDATPLPWGSGTFLGALPTWYMPAPTSRRANFATRVAVGSVVAGMLVVCAFGLCVTSGFLQWA